MDATPRSAAIVAALTIAWLLHPLTAAAGHKDNPPPQPGFVHQEQLGNEPPEHHGIILAGHRVLRSSPVIAEIDGNVANGKEVAVGGEDGRLYVYRSDGSLLWDRDVYRQPCTWVEGDGLIHSSPAVGDIEGNGIPYVVIGYGTFMPSACDGGVIAYRGDTGAVAWRWSLVDHPEPTHEQRHGVYSTPALADTDGDGKMEVAFGAFSRYIYLMNHDGTLRMRYHSADTVGSSPAFADLDGDGHLEMLIGSDISANPFLSPPTYNGGYVYAFDTEQRTPPDLYFREGYKWMTYLDQTIASSPAVADVLPDSPGLEVVIGSGSYFPEGSTHKNGRWVKILRGSDGTVLRTLDAPCLVRSSPSVADLDDDGFLEVVAVTSGDPALGCDGYSRVVAWDPDNATPKWSVAPNNANSGAGMGNDPSGDISSPVIADLDGNGSLEVVVSNASSVHVLRGIDGVPLTCQSLSCGSQLSLYGWGYLMSTPAVGDIDGNGVLEVVAAGTHSGTDLRGTLYAWTGLAAAGLGSPAGLQKASAAPWPMFRLDPRRNGRLVSPPRLTALPASLTLFHQAGDTGTETIGFQVLNAGEQDFTWSATASMPGTVSVSPAGGTVSGRASARVTVTVGTQHQAPGTHDLGTILLEGTSGGTPIAGSPLSLPVSLITGEVRRLYLPGVVR